MDHFPPRNGVFWGPGGVACFEVQEYGVCSKEVTMTSSFSIENSQRIRKLLIGEETSPGIGFLGFKAV